MAWTTCGSTGLRLLSVTENTVVGWPVNGELGAPPPTWVSTGASTRCLTSSSSGMMARAASVRAASVAVSTSIGVGCWARARVARGAAARAMNAAIVMVETDGCLMRELLTSTTP
ncbi:MAG: hypothetical protein R2712_10375 [Vicinamibacterales bacterium]